MNLFRHIADSKTLEREYSPSSCVKDLGAILAAYGTRSAAARERLQRIVLTYGESAAEQCDFFPAPSTRRAQTPRPVVIYIHGGYWQELSKDEQSFPAVALSNQDVSYVAVNYGLAPQATLDEMVSRCRRAIVWIAAHCSSLQIDPAAIHLAGCSAGAHLAAMTALTDWTSYGLPGSPLRSVCLLSGVFDLRPLPLTYINDAVGMSAEDALRNSPALLIDAARGEFPPALIVWGEHETAEFKRQSTEFAAALVRKGGCARAEEIRDRNHFDLVFDLGDPATHFGALTLEHFGLMSKRAPDRPLVSAALER